MSLKRDESLITNAHFRWLDCKIAISTPSRVTYNIEWSLISSPFCLQIQDKMALSKLPASRYALQNTRSTYLHLLTEVIVSPRNAHVCEDLWLINAKCSDHPTQKRHKKEKKKEREIERACSYPPPITQNQNSNNFL